MNTKALSSNGSGKSEAEGSLTLQSSGLIVHGRPWHIDVSRSRAYRPLVEY
jgi:hypothetical protein